MSPYPVCCTSKVPISILEKFLDAALAGSENLVPNSEHELAIVTVAGDGSSSLPKLASKPPLGDTITPFIADSIQDASQNVGGATFFAVIDEQSANEEIAILGSTQPDDTVQTAQVTFDSVQQLLTALSVATIGFAEIQAIAADSEGVYGKRKTSPKRGGPAPRKRLVAD